MLIIFIIVHLSLSQLLTHQERRPAKLNYDLTQDRIDCRVTHEESIISICKNCKAKNVYLLDEQNWLIVGVYHGFGYMFKKPFRKEIILKMQESTALSTLTIYVFQSKNQQSIQKNFLKNINSNFTELDVKCNDNQKIFKVTNFAINGEAQIDGFFQNQLVTVKNKNLINIIKRGELRAKNRTNYFQLEQSQDEKNQTVEKLTLQFEQVDDAFQEFVAESYSDFYQKQIQSENESRIVKIIKAKSFNKRKFTLTMLNYNKDEKVENQM